MEKKISLATFEQVAADNGYEVFTAEEVAAYYKDGLQKSMKNELTSDEKELFAADIAFLQKAICIDENGKEVTRYFRPEQVNWEKTEDGVLLKGIAGVFADTPTNRKLNRVGEAFVPSPDFMKSLESEEIDEDIIKAMRTGRYADTPENRRLHRVGQPYAKREGKGTEETDKEKKRVGDTKAEIEKLDAKYGKVYAALGKRKQEALERGDKAEAKRMTDAIARMEKEHDDEVAKLKEKEGGEKGDEKLHAKADERKGGEKGDKKLHEEAEKKKKRHEDYKYDKMMYKRDKESYSEEAVVSESKAALKEAFGKLSYRDEGGEEIVAEAGEGGDNEQLGDFGLLLDKKSGKVTLYDAVDGDDLMTGYPTNGVFMRKMKEKMGIK